METRTKAGYALVAGGLCLVLLGLGWQAVVPDSAFWSEEDAAEYNRVFLEAHAATSGLPVEGGEDHASHNHAHDYAHSHADAGGPVDIETARRRVAEARDRLELARNARTNGGRVVAIAGAVAAVAGLLMSRKPA